MFGYLTDDSKIESVLKKLRLDAALRTKNYTPLKICKNIQDGVNSISETPSPNSQDSPFNFSAIKSTFIWHTLEKFNHVLRMNNTYNLLYSGIINKITKNNRTANTLKTLLAYHDEEFIVQSYRVLLERDPDPIGSQGYLKHLRDGSKTKIDILAGIRFYTEEGIEHGINIKGLRRRFLINKALMVPFLGYCARLFIIAVQLPKLHSKLDRLNTKVAHDAIQIKMTFNEKAVYQELNFKMIGDEIISLKDMLLSLREEKQLLQNELIKLNQELSETKSEILDQKRNVLDQQRRHALLLEEASKRMPEPFSPEQISNILEEKNHLYDALYVSFEDRFRGTREVIKNRAQAYIPYLPARENYSMQWPILDIGCGRGEWLELLKENNFTATGIDSNTLMISECMDRGLSVVETDAIGYLRNQNENSFGVITGFHIIEHLQFESIISLLDECVRILKSGGMLILETPNPENLLVGSCNFYADPTHKNPIPPNTLKFIAEARGFGNIEIIRLHPPDMPNQMEDMPGPLLKLFNMELDYSIIAYKP